jgi:hypothetical protein
MIQALDGILRATSQTPPWLARLLIAANDNSRPEPPPAAAIRVRRLANTRVGGLPQPTAREPLLQVAGG